MHAGKKYSSKRFFLMVPDTRLSKETIENMFYRVTGRSQGQMWSGRTRLREHEDRSIEIIQSEEQKDKRMKKNEKSIRDLRKITSVTT